MSYIIPFSFELDGFLIIFSPFFYRVNRVGFVSIFFLFSLFLDQTDLFFRLFFCPFFGSDSFYRFFFGSVFLLFFRTCFSLPGFLLDKFCFFAGFFARSFLRMMEAPLIL